MELSMLSEQKTDTKVQRDLQKGAGWSTADN